MEKKKNISPSIEEAKQRIELYNDLCESMKGLKRDERRRVISQLADYFKLLDSKRSMESALYLRYVTCTNVVFHYLYKMRQIDREGGIDPEIRKHVEDVFITILKDYDAD